MRVVASVEFYECLVILDFRRLDVSRYLFTEPQGEREKKIVPVRSKNLKKKGNTFFIWGFTQS